MSSTFDADAVQRLARLARLDLTPDERALFARQLAEILTFVEQIQQVDTTGVPPTSHPTGAETTLRDDARVPSLPRDQVLAQAPEADAAAGLFKVPRVLGA